MQFTKTFSMNKKKKNTKTTQWYLTWDGINKYIVSTTKVIEHIE